MNQNFYKNLFKEYRMMFFDDLHTQVCDMPKALTLNENLKAYGYTLRPQDIYALASSPSLDLFFENFVSMIPKVKAKPMYPDFPIEIMEMEEATFRFHQLLHYFSTYGIELLTGQEVQKGWLPEKEEIEKTKEDETLLTCKVIELIKASQMYSVLFKKIVSKKERLSIPEKEMLEDIVKSMDPATLSQTSIPFKENLMPIVYSIVKERKAVVPVLCELCQHTGDVLKCFDYFLVRNHYKVSKEEQRLFIQVLESYSIADFMNNVILSNRKANRTKVLLNYLNYNRYSKSPAHKEVVRALRNDELSSWYGKEDTMIFRWLVSNNLDVEKEALSFIGNRPGDMFRQLNYLYKLGFSTNSLFEEMGKHIASLSLETLVSTYSKFDSNEDVRELMHHILQEKMKTMHTPFQNKKVYLEKGNYSFEHSRLEINEKSQEGGYIRSGLAFKIPEDCSIVRFFVYWNDKKRIDIDLHAHAHSEDGDFYVGWNSNFKKNGVYFSGDITHSNAAEYIDIQMNNPELKSVSTRICSFTGVPFDRIETCFVGMLAVKDYGQEVKLYNPKNCFYYHELKSNVTEMRYASIDIDNKVLRFVGKKEEKTSLYSLQEYLDDYCLSQNAELVDTKEEADFVLRMDKAIEENELSMIDQNFWLRN